MKKGSAKGWLMELDREQYAMVSRARPIVGTHSGGRMKSTMGRTLAMTCKPICLVLCILLGAVGTAQAATTVTTLTYDAGNHVTRVTDPRGLVTTYTYDGLGQLWQQVSPDTGTTTFDYDNYGRRASLTRGDGTQTTYGYDSLNRVVSISAGGLTQTFTYDNCTNGIGRLCSDSDANTTTAYAYTPQGWVTSRSFTVDNTSYALNYSYDTMGRVNSVTYPDGNQASYTYSDGTVSDVTLNVGGSNVAGASNITYRPGNLEMSGWTSSNGLTNALSYDSDGRLTSIVVPGVENLTFTYDLADRITKITNGMDTTLTQSFTYDDLSRLTDVSSTADTEHYQYDADGNRLSAVINGESWAYTIASGSNRLVSASNSSSWSGSYQYDANGNMLGTAHQYWTYDAFNRMRTATPSSGTPVTTYDVDPEGQRLSKYTSSMHTYFAPDRSGALLAEYQSPQWTDYVRLNGRVVAIMMGGAVYSVHTDQVGRPEVVTNADQATIWQAENLAFDRTVTTSGITLNLGFPGQYFDSEAGSWGIWHNGYRDYAASPYFGGRYLESDPIGLSGGVNTYSYTVADPVNSIDPYGLEAPGPWTFPAGPDRNAFIASENQPSDPCYFHKVNEEWSSTNNILPGKLSFPTLGFWVGAGGAAAKALEVPTINQAAGNQLLNWFVMGKNPVVVNWAGAFKGSILSMLAVTAAYQGGLYAGSMINVGIEDTLYGVGSGSCGCKK